MGIAERKQREKEARSAQIKNAAATIFQKKGYEATTMDEIAQLCELSKPSIYIYFKGKDDLFYSIVEPALTKISKRLVKIADNKNESAVDTIKKLVNEVFRHYDKYPDIYQMLMQNNIKTLPPNKANHLENIIRSNISQMEKAVQKGIDQGTFQRVDTKVTAIIILNCFTGVFFSQSKRMEGGRSDYRKSTVNSALELILAGLKKK
ncbi:MAG: TetR/AcrR family transcriptional regulator [Smithellaceae bacterium]